MSVLGKIGEGKSTPASYKGRIQTHSTLTIRISL
jgi:hypothetical protein